MKQLVARAASEVLYYLGHWIHFPMIWWDWAWLYPIYNRLMSASHAVQTWGGSTGPWQHTKEKQ
jgi:hypothetical protein